MKYVQINTYYDGSTGFIMRKLHRELQESGEDSYIFWGRHQDTAGDHEQCFASKSSVYWHGAMVRLTDRMGFYSKRDTAKLLKRLDEIAPDVVHLHNIHGYYINIEMLFDWLAAHSCQVKWTLHDCWAFTGHCAYFTYAKCAQWKTHCAYDEPCCQLHTYPKTYSKRSCAKNYEEKHRIFTSIPTDRMTLITPSHWLEGLVKESFLKDYPVVVKHNTIDKTIFKPTTSDFRERYGIGDRFMILGVASPWTERKGLNDFVKLANVLDSEKYAIVLIGLNKKQIRKLRGSSLIALPRKDSAFGLAEAYTAADVFFNPTKEDNYPTVNLEAQACGTSVVTYDVGGCRETLNSDHGVTAKRFEEALVTMKQIAGGGLLIYVFLSTKASDRISPRRWAA